MRLHRKRRDRRIRPNLWSLRFLPELVWLLRRRRELLASCFLLLASQTDLRRHVDMCCACGGGSANAPPTEAPTITSRPSISPAPAPSPASCFDTDDGAFFWRRREQMANAPAATATPTRTTAAASTASASRRTICAASAAAARTAYLRRERLRPTITSRPSSSLAPTVQGQGVPLAVGGHRVVLGTGGINDIYEPMGTTLDGRWYVQGMSNGVMLYFDYDCDGSGAPLFRSPCSSSRSERSEASVAAAGTGGRLSSKTCTRHQWGMAGAKLFFDDKGHGIMNSYIGPKFGVVAPCQ